MNFKKTLKRNQKIKAQAILEYVVLLAAAILAIIAVNFWITLRGQEENPSGFELHFQEMVGPAGGLDYGAWQ
jgi:cytoskeletal protein RodZ